MKSSPPMPYPPKRIPPLGPPRLTPRQRALAAWRGSNLAPLEKIRERPAQSAGVVVPKVLAELRLERRLAEAEIVRVWNHLIDPVITAHAQPVGLNKGTLFVNIDHSAWLNEIVRYRRKEILERLRHSFGPDLIVKISYRLGG
jgi:predicted nucleic acid-binding Zn ribbon protein